MRSILISVYMCQYRLIYTDIHTLKKINSLFMNMRLYAYFLFTHFRKVPCTYTYIFLNVLYEYVYIFRYVHMYICFLFVFSSRTPPGPEI